MTVEDFWEIGASGRIYRRADVIETVAARYRANEPDDHLVASDFACRQLAEDLFQLTYNLLQGTRRTRRSTA